MVGAKLVFPGPGLDGKSLYELIESERVTMRRRRADGLAGPASTYMKQNDLQVLDAQAHDDRRLGVPAGDDPDAARRVRRARHAWLGHDRDEPASARSATSQGEACESLADERVALALNKQGRPFSASR